MPLNAIDGAVLLILGALLVAFYYALRATPRARRDIPIVTNTPKPCERTGCHLLGYYPDTHVDGHELWTCAGCHDDGHRAGWLVTT